MISQVIYNSLSFLPATPKMFVLEIVPRLQKEQASTISKQKAKWNWFFLIFGLKVHSQEGKQSAN